MHRSIIPDVVKSRHVCSLSKTATAAEAAIEMVTCDVAAIIVVDATAKMVGIITERDLTRQVIAKGLDPAKTLIGEIMTSNPKVLSPDNTAGDALEMMRNFSFRHIPVMDGDSAVAMVSIRDLYAAVKADLEDDKGEVEAFVFGNQYGA